MNLTQAKILGKSAIKALEIPTKIVAGVVSLVAIGGFIFPKLIWTPIEGLIAQHFGVSGWVYYEVGKNKKGDRALTKDGKLYLLKSSNALYDDVKLGDKLRASSPVNFREDSTRRSRVMFHLNENDCVIVISDKKIPYSGRFVDTDAEVKPESGGWLKVATTPCGLFER